MSETSSRMRADRASRAQTPTLATFTSHPDKADPQEPFSAPRHRRRIHSSRGHPLFGWWTPGSNFALPSAENVETDYRRAVLPMALQAHGQEVIHASAVITEDGVVAFCGRSQTGKSTVAYGLHRRGYRVWADDTLVFDASAEFVQVIPYPHRLRIRS